MTDFFKGLFSKILDVFKSSPDFETNIQNFQTKVDSIITDLLVPLTSTEISGSDKYRELLMLLDPTKCNRIALTLSSIRNLIPAYLDVQSRNWDYEKFIGRQMNYLNI
jgi:hypothetical protein